MCSLTSWDLGLKLLNLAVPFFESEATTFRFPCSSFGNAAYPTNSVIFIELSTCDGIFAGGGYETFEGRNFGVQEERSLVS